MHRKQHRYVVKEITYADEMKKKKKKKHMKDIKISLL